MKKTKQVKQKKLILQNPIINKFSIVVLIG